jgi:Ran GTPase-activating protein (RanGAP) involved in mRNA processing and transport
MDAASIELSLASRISKKRKHAGFKNDFKSSTDDDDSDGNASRILDLTARKGFGFEECAVLANMLASNSNSNNDNNGGNNCKSKKNYAITELLMSKIGIGPKGGILLAESLGKTNQTTIVHLDLERNGLGAVGACAIFRALATNNTLRTLNMSLNDVKAATSAGNNGATMALGDALQTNNALAELLLVRSGLGPKGGKDLAFGLSKNHSLVKLDLVGNDIMADGGQAIGEALKTNTTLRDLNLRWNRIGCGGDRGILSLADSLRFNDSLRKLDMSVNELYCEGAIAFGIALGAANNHSLLDLNLERNEIGVSGAVAIAQALQSNTTLSRLVLSGNPMIADEGAAAIGQSLMNDYKHEHDRSGLCKLEMVGCGVGIEGARAFGRVLKERFCSLQSLCLERNKIGAEGTIAIAEGLGENSSLRHLNLSRNGIQAGGGTSLALALQKDKNRMLDSLDISNNDIEVENGNSHIIESIVDHPCLRDVDVSSNSLEIVPIDVQLRLARRIYKDQRENIIVGTKHVKNIDLSDNPLSSPPLGRRADVEGLKTYLKMLLSDSTAVNRIRLMVLGFGGVGKSTFCDAVTQPKDMLPYFHGSLVPLEEWDVQLIASWGRRLGTHWAPFIGSMLENNKISGEDLQSLIVDIPKHNEEDGKYEPSKMLKDLVDNESGTDGFAMSPSEVISFARAIGSLMRKGYFSTVGAVKLEGVLELKKTRNDSYRGHDTGKSVGGSSPRRTCSLVDFAGQMEYLVSHQLLLSSLHTLCVVLQPAPSFGNPQSRHYGSWKYWSRFLRALGDRRRGSLLLAISQQDKVASSLIDDVNDDIKNELYFIRSSIPNITESPPLCLDYRPEYIQTTVEDIRGALSGAADVVARDWWVPSSYETLAELVRRMEDEKKSNREVPIVSRKELFEELPSVGLHRMYEDRQLFKRGIEYLEAVGDVMTDDRLDCLLLDPISWFASFLAHFIRDDDIVTSVQLESRLVERGVVSLEDVVSALEHDYAKPQEQVAQIMSLVCRLELCIRDNDKYCETNNDSGEECKVEEQETPVDSQDEGSNHESIGKSSGATYLFPCLLPPATASELTKHWPAMHQDSSSESLVYRGHRFRSRSEFFPPGLFPGLLARCRLLRSGILSSGRMWKNCAVLTFGNHTRLLLRIDLNETNAILDVVGAAPTAEGLFVGGAKGQASAVIWMTHLVKIFLRRSYPQLETDEFFLCPSAECHAMNLDDDDNNDDDDEEIFHPCLSCYNGTEFPAVPQSGKRYKGDHSCEADGCWSQLGQGHKIEQMKPKATTEDHGLRCSTCQREARFALRT